MGPKILFAMLALIPMLASYTAGPLKADLVANALSNVAEAEIAVWAAMNAAYEQVHELGRFVENAGYYDVTFLLSAP